MSKPDDNVPKDISITKIKYTDTNKRNGNIKDLIKEFLEDNLKIEKKTESPTEKVKNGRKVFTFTSTIKKESTQAGEKDQNHGELCFVYWGSDATSVNIYCLANPGLSGAWAYLRPIRDCYFPRKFAKTFLNSRKIRKVEVSYLSDTNYSSSVQLPFKEGKFESYDITDKYGIVKTFSAPIDDRTPQGSELCDMLIESPQKKNPIKVQIGQIKLPLYVTKDRKISPEQHIDMLLMIHEHIYENKSINSCTDQDWTFIEYIQPIFDKEKTVKLENNLSKRVFDYLCNKENNQELPFDSKLTYVHQDCFDAGEIELLHNGVELFEFPIKGEYLTLSHIFDCINKKSDLDEFDNHQSSIINQRLCKQYITKPTDLNDVKLTFYDWIEKQRVSIPFLEMVQCQLTVPFGNEMLPAFKFEGKWYIVKLESYFDITMNFVDVVEKCLKNDSGVEFPEVLPWSNKTEKETKRHEVFSMDVLYDFCVELNEMNPRDRANAIDKLKDILIKPIQLLKNKIKSLDEKYITYKNNFLRTFMQESQNRFNRHSVELLSLNTCIIKKRKDPCPKDVQERVTYDDLVVLQQSTDKKVEKENKRSNEFCQKLNEDSQTLYREAENTFSVETPYLSIDVWDDIERAGINICPVRLVQFLRMYSTKLCEGDYNELYHLSNCKCRRYNHGFIYVVGDRIFDNENHNIELFDVMAANFKTKTFYLLHVKSDFNAGSARDMCSQVSVCGQFMQSLTTKTYNRTMLQKFYAVATKPSRLVHETLTKMEIEMIGESEEQFLEAMMCGDVKYHVCAAPCLPKGRFSSVLNVNMKHVFTESDFDYDDVFYALQRTGVIDNITKTINPIIFDRLYCIRKIETFNTKAEQVYKGIFGIMSRGKTNSLINPISSVIAKIMLIDLYKKFKTFGSKVELGIIDVPLLESNLKTSDDDSDLDISMGALNIG